MLFVSDIQFANQTQEKQNGDHMVEKLSLSWIAGEWMASEWIDFRTASVRQELPHYLVWRNFAESHADAELLIEAGEVLKNQEEPFKDSQVPLAVGDVLWFRGEKIFRISP